MSEPTPREKATNEIQRTKIGRIIFEARKRLAAEAPEPQHDRAMFYRHHEWEKLSEWHREYYRRIADAVIDEEQAASFARATDREMDLMEIHSQTMAIAEPQGSPLIAAMREARQLQMEGRYIKGAVFHALCDEIERLAALPGPESKGTST